MIEQIMYKYHPWSFKATDGQGGFAGYASVFGVRDAQGDVVSRGAFAASLDHWRASGRLPPLLWQHDPRVPIGCFDGLREDDRGLWAEARLALDTPRGMEAYRLMKMGAIDGLSIGYTPAQARASGGDGRTLDRIELHEISLVTMPANDASRVTWVKGLEVMPVVSLAAIADSLRRARAALS